MSDDISRRRLLTLSGSGLAASLTGCSEVINPDYLPGRQNSDATESPEANDDVSEDGPTNQPPPTPAGKITRQNGQAYPLHKLQPYTEYLFSSGRVDWSEISHPDSRQISAKLTRNKLVLTISQLKLNRDVTITSYIPQQNGGTTKKKTTLSPESDKSRTYEISQELNGVSHLKHEEGQLVTTLTDSHSADSAERILNIHRFINIPYDDSYGSGNHFINNEGVQFNTWKDSNGGKQIDNPKESHTEYVDTDTVRRRFYTVEPLMQWESNRHEQEKSLISAYSLVTHQAGKYYKRNKTGELYTNRYHPTRYMYNASDYEYFTAFADSLTSSLDANGITSHFERLQSLNRIIGGMPYERVGKAARIQFGTIYSGTANCSEGTFLFMAIANLPEFNNTRCAYLSCNIPNYGLHAVAGIDERDLEKDDVSEMSFITPSESRKSNGLPDTRYAYTELTDVRDIGERSPNVNVKVVLDTTNLKVNPDLREPAPEV